MYTSREKIDDIDTMKYAAFEFGAAPIAAQKNTRQQREP